MRLQEENEILKKANRYKEENIKLDKEIMEIYIESKRRYGSPKIKKSLESKELKKVSQKRYGKHMTADLVIQALINAVCRRGIKEGMIFHSDLGSQYTSNDYEELLKTLKIKHSYSKKGYPYDNASMESFNAILKKEEVNQKSYVTFKEARQNPKIN